MTALPVRLKINIRDLWESESSTLQESIKELKEVIGYSVEISPEWGMLWAELQEHYPDSSTFVPTIVNVVIAWCKALKKLADDEANEEWTDEFLEKVKDYQKLKALLSVNGDERPSTTWSQNQSLFRIDIPKKGQFTIPTMTAGFVTDLANCFNGKVQPPSKASVEPSLDDGWDAVVIDSSQKQNSIKVEPIKPRGNTIKELPIMNTLPRPEELLLRPPFHLVMAYYSAKEIMIQCSHEPSLRLLFDYLTKWCKRNDQRMNRPPAVEIRLRESPFGLGLVYDRLQISVDHHTYGLSAPMLLNLIEAVLGYKMVYGDASTWTFRKGDAEL